MEISIYLSLGLVVIAIILQSTLSPLLSFNYVHPNLVVIVVLALSMLRELKEALIISFVAGALLDLLSPVPFGVFTISLLIVAGLAGFWQRRLVHSFSYFLSVSLALPYTILFNLCVAILLQLSGFPIVWNDILRAVIVPVSLLSVLVMAVVYPLVYWVNRTFGEKVITI